jgi:hypothetical protein
MNDWERWVKRRLRDDGYELLDPRECDAPFLIVARRSGFDISKFGNCERFFIFAEFEYLTEGRMRRFCSAAFDNAIRMKKCGLPCGFFEFVCSYAVAVTADVDRDAIESVREDEPSKHWSAVEFPVIWNPERDRLAYFEKTPFWGAFYWGSFRSEIENVLGR